MIERIKTPIAKANNTDSGQRYPRIDPPNEPAVLVTVGDDARGGGWVDVGSAPVVAVAWGTAVFGPTTTPAVGVCVAVGCAAGGTGVAEGAVVGVSTVVGVSAGVSVTAVVGVVSVVGGVDVAGKVGAGVQVGVPGPTGL